MKYRIFQFSLPTPDPECAELNSFLASHRVSSISKEFVRGADTSLLVFVVEYVDAKATDSSSPRPRIDYREKLTEPQYVVFSRLRDLRKKLADDIDSPVFTIFSNAQLAEIVTRNVSSLEELAAIEGIGKSRIEKYGSQVLDVLNDVQTTQAATATEQDSPVD